MAKQCELTGKKPSRGYTYAIRGIAKKKKGIGLKVTGKTKRRFQPNLVVKRIWNPEEKRFVRMRISVAALRTIDKVGIAPLLRKARAERVCV
ncbi:MAG: 50S ribosomal protein L28 [Chlamydiales bacterium]|jgi:large subunit ribosomal protein L28|nr:50S ribosomal protein L28 [Chlamydiales bacterium]